MVFNMAVRTLCIGCLFVVFFSFKPTQCEPFQAPSYTIDLDLAPEERWLNITQKYLKYTPKILANLRKKIPPFAIPLAEKLAVVIDKHFPAEYNKEMMGISKGLNLSFSDTILLNILYDVTAFCTSIVAQDKDGSVFHGRNLDYSFTDTLRDITFISNFQSKGKL